MKTLDANRQSFNNGHWDGWHDAQSGQSRWDDGIHPNQDYLAGYNYGYAAFKEGLDENSMNANWSKYQMVKEQTRLLRQEFAPG